MGKNYCPNCNTKVPLLKLFKNQFFKDYQCENCNTSLSPKLHVPFIVIMTIFISSIDDIYLKSILVIIYFFSIEPITAYLSGFK